MARTEKPSRSKESTTQALKGPTRDVAISKAMSYVLRHAAQKEGVRMDAAGYVRCDELLNWRKLRSHATSFSDLIEVVRDNAKQRFSLLYSPPPVSNDPPSQPGPLASPYDSTALPHQLGPRLDVAEMQPSQSESNPDSAHAPASIRSSHEEALFRYDAPPTTRDHNPAHFLIRATQGHSLPVGLVDPSTYLKPITLEDVATIPETVVHGTFYHEWRLIVASGGLKRMGRVHVHFATGPSVREITGDGIVKQDEDNDDAHKEKSLADEQDATEAVMHTAPSNGKERDPKDDGEDPAETDGKEVVRSGMRNDAPVLIYLDIRKALQLGYTFWMSENGVVLCDGIRKDSEASGQEGSAAPTAALIPTSLFSLVFERESGVGVLWEDGKEVRQLPERLASKGRGKGKAQAKEGGGRKGKGRGGKWKDQRGGKARPGLGYVEAGGELLDD